MNEKRPCPTKKPTRDRINPEGIGRYIYPNAIRKATPT
jgi:hypothetical protein